MTLGFISFHALILSWKYEKGMYSTCTAVLDATLYTSVILYQTMIYLFPVIRYNAPNSFFVVVE